MHVRTAVETLSSSAADSMDFLRKNGIPQFADAGGTRKFPRNFDRLRDNFNFEQNAIRMSFFVVFLVGFFFCVVTRFIYALKAQLIL